MDRKYGYFNSWNIVSNNVAMKVTDKSFFEFNNTGVPKVTRWFWDRVDDGRNGSIKLLFDGKEYRAYLSTDNQDSTKLHWYKELSSQFELIFQYSENTQENDYPTAKFLRISERTFQVDILADEENYIGSAVEYTPQTEGERKLYTSYKIERNNNNRKNCISIHGYNCRICGFNYEKVYGELGEGFIVIHHIKPLSTTGKIKIDPEKDLIPVCANCHNMLHRKKGAVISIEDLQKEVQRHKVLDFEN